MSSFERLEDRCVPAVDAALVNGVLTIAGDKQDNLVIVELDAPAPIAQNVLVSIKDDDGFRKISFSNAAINSIAFTGGAGDDTFLNFTGKLTVADGGAGNDLLRGGFGSDTLLGGGGKDTLDGANGNDSLDGGAGADVLEGSFGNDLIQAGSGDIVQNREAGDMVLGSGYLRQQAVADVLFDDATKSIIINGDNSRDVVIAEFAFNQQLRIVTMGSNGYKTAIFPILETDRIVFNGRGGDDVFVSITSENVEADGGAGNDFIRGGVGNDILKGGAGNDIIDANKGDDIAEGGAGADFIIGDDGNDLVDGGAGDDYIEGGTGDDALIGGIGRDIIYDNIGNNRVIGGEAADLVLVNATTSVSSDRKDTVVRIDPAISVDSATQAARRLFRLGQQRAVDQVLSGDWLRVPTVCRR